MVYSAESVYTSIENKIQYSGYCKQKSKEDKSLKSLELSDAPHENTEFYVKKWSIMQFNVSKQSY